MHLYLQLILHDLPIPNWLYILKSEPYCSDFYSQDKFALKVSKGAP